MKSDMTPLLLILLVLAYIVFRSWGWWRKNELGSLTLPDGKTYWYTIGDTMNRYFDRSTFAGMGVKLQHTMPHIYLDSRRGGGRRARYIIDTTQRVSLEGDFDKYFQLYVPDGAQTLALSVITPDVMQKLMSVAGDYDIELYNDQLRIISSKAVLKHLDRRRAMMEILEAVLLELDQKFASWTPADDKAATRPLQMYRFRGVRFGKRYIPLGLCLYIVGWVLSGSLIAFIAFSSLNNPHNHGGHGTDWIVLGIAALYLAVAAFVWFVLYRRYSKFRPDELTDIL